MAEKSKNEKVEKLKSEKVEESARTDSRLTFEPLT